MLFAFAACTQKLEIRIVDKDGHDVDLSALVPANNNTTPDQPTQVEPTPTQPQQPVATTAPTGETTTAAQGGTETTTAGGTEAPTQAPAPTNTVPSTKDEIVAFFAKAVNDIKNNGSASYNKKEYQTMGELNITGIGAVDNAIKGVAGNYFKGEDQVDLQVAEKGTDSSKDKMHGWPLSDTSKVVSATLNQNGGNYDITIVMQDEDTPHKGGGSHLDAVGSVLLWEDIDKELQGVSILKEYNDVHVRYTNYTITATISPDGKLSALRHHTDISIDIGSAKILFATLKDKHVTLENTMVYSNFVY
jgi:hypothetical protein